MSIGTRPVRAPQGRPRSTEADEAIAHAALALIAEAGFDGVTVEAVAQRAGVARTTVYRRYPGKPELLVTVLAHACRAVVDDPDTGSVVGDLTAIAEALDRALTSTDIGRALPAVIAAAAQHPDVAAAHRTFVASRRRVALAAVARGIERGEVDPEVDPDTLVDLVVGPVFHRRFVSRRPVGDGWIAEIVSRAVRGCAPTGPPSRRSPNAE
jgi:AcrR family transcriptional regulator